jgi:hypothetical protein
MIEKIFTEAPFYWKNVFVPKFRDELRKLKIRLNLYAATADKKPVVQAL